MCALLRKDEKVLIDKDIRKGLEPDYRKKLTVRIIAAIASFVASVVFSLALVIDLEKETALFKHGAWLFRLGAVICIIASIVCVICVLLIPRRQKEVTIIPNEADVEKYYSLEPFGMKCARYICTALVFAGGSTMVVLAFANKINAPQNPLFLVLSLVLFVPLALYFFSELAVATAPANPRIYLVYGTIGLFWFIATVANGYLDRTYPISSEYFIFGNVALITVMLYLTYEMKLRTSTPAPRARLAFLCIASIFNIGYTVGRIVMLVFGNSISLGDTAMITISLGFSVYLGARMFFYSED